MASSFLGNELAMMKMKGLLLLRAKRHIEKVRLRVDLTTLQTGRWGDCLYTDFSRVMDQLDLVEDPNRDEFSPELLRRRLLAVLQESASRVSVVDNNHFSRGLL